MATRLCGLVIEALDVRAQARFWAQALQWHLSERDPDGLRVAVRPTRDEAQDKARDEAQNEEIGLLFIPTIRPKTTKNRIHLDLTAGIGQARQVGRLLELGAIRADIGQRDVPWDVLADPEGNEFCVLTGEDPDHHLAAVCLDAADPMTQGRFWAAATGWQIVDKGDWGVRFRSPAGHGPALVMGPPAAPRAGRNRLCLDLATDPGGDAAAEAARLVTVGASHVGHLHDRATPPLTLADPEGNEFRVIEG
ncbi:MAG TPA: VOC family protein [Actinocrinis sp.]|nr:VOC family protein [Actinocrinis sp.]